MILNSFVNISVGPFRRLGFVPISKQKEGFLNFESMSHFSNERRRFSKRLTLKRFTPLKTAQRA
jgi:hypothetical protein